MNLLRSDCFDNPDIVEKCSRVLICLVLESVLTGCIDSNRGDVSSFARKNFIFCDVSTVDFLVKIGWRISTTSVW